MFKFSCEQLINSDRSFKIVHMPILKQRIFVPVSSAVKVGQWQVKIKEKVLLHVPVAALAVVQSFPIEKYGRGHICTG